MKTLRKPMLLFLIVGLLFALCAGTLAIGAAAERNRGCSVCNDGIR